MIESYCNTIEPRHHRMLCQLVARAIPTLKWRHSGLGMLQAYMREGKTNELRVHIWHEELRREGIEESGLLHDHRFDLHSVVLVGRITNVEFELIRDPNGAWQLHEVVHARAAAGDKHAPNDGLVTALPQRYRATRDELDIHRGSEYFFPKRAFHGTYHNQLTVTLVTKSNQEDVPARIMAPYGKPVVHAFAEPLPESAWARSISEAIAALEAVW